ncbi:hypothetical protein OCHUTO_0751 [Orientia chuto str. Dubai]|uniref:Uncharacterized protein n=1 Tax=Orientia chuto str. Dubai TaxID=1359168 RepID=A0A0F3MJ16_9RICK|nr:hypothetical protein [Candidatus Orientia mediorientalis]KJV55636.1 hypothetical protein OCHUTO_0751 [Orientia chuto str. Dubai]
MLNLQEYINQDDELKSILEQHPKVKEYISYILKHYNYKITYFNQLFTKIGGCYSIIEKIKLLQCSNIKASSINSIINKDSTAPRVLAELLDKLTDSRIKTLQAQNISFTSIGSILKGSGAHAPRVFEELLEKLTDSRIKKLQAQNINFKSIWFYISWI